MTRIALNFILEFFIPIFTIRSKSVVLEKKVIIW